MTPEEARRNKAKRTRRQDRAMSLIGTISRLRMDGDIIDGEEYLADGNDDDVDALYSLIRIARSILADEEP